MSKDKFLSKYVIKKSIILFIILSLIIYVNVVYTNNSVLLIMIVLYFRHVINILNVISNFKKYLGTIGDEYVTLQIKGLLKFNYVNDFNIKGFTCIPIGASTKTISLSNIILSGVYVLNLPSYNIDMNSTEFIYVKAKKTGKKFIKKQLVIFNEKYKVEQINHVEVYEKKMHTFKYDEGIIKFIKVEDYDEY